MAAMPEDVYDRLRHVEDNSLRNTLGLAAHEKECAIRYTHINESVSGIRKDLRAAAGFGIATGVAVLAFLIKLVFFP